MTDIDRMDYDATDDDLFDEWDDDETEAEVDNRFEEFLDWLDEDG